ncbi:hypothetical protein J4477_01395 [Candidatus Pacearchaeota archaeon]|nr:hypothetical protein [Candidatus Pacearchaeota archaeon]
MKIRVKKIKDGSVSRVEGGGEIKEILINENFLEPNNEAISLCFRGVNSSGIIEISLKELNEIHKALKEKKHLIKGFKIMKFDRD